MILRRRFSPLFGLLLPASLILSGCAGTPPKPVTLKGAGATFPYLAYSKWITEYKQEKPSVTIEYRPVGSGEGIEELLAGKIDFAGSDVPLSDEQLARFKVKPQHFPTLVGAVVPVYNVKGVGQLNFTGEMLADIMSGRIASWSDPAIQELNAGVSLPSAPIRVIHRSEASGTTFLFTSYLSAVSPSWKQGPGQGTRVQWPLGREVAGNDAVAEAVHSTPGAISYVELNYANKAKLTYGAVRNSAGEFQKATFESLGAAMDALEIPADFRTVASNAKGKQAYPIAGMTYLLVPSSYSDPAKSYAMRKFLTWAYSDGQKSALSLEYNLLPPPLLEKVTAQIDAIR